MTALICETACDLLDLLPLEALEADEKASLDEHLATCGSCRDRAKQLDNAYQDAHALALEVCAAAQSSAGAAAAAEPPAPQPKLVTEPAPRVSLSCTFCHDALTRSHAVYCSDCLAPAHSECFVEHGRCSATGCDGNRIVRPGQPQRPRRVAKRRLRWVIPFALGGVLTGAAAVTALLWTPPGTGKVMGFAPSVSHSERPMLFDVQTLSGVWDGGLGWGQVFLRGTRGTYSNDNGTGQGRFELHQVSRNRWKGTWGESKRRFGTFEVTRSADGKQLSGTWLADPRCAIKPNDQGVMTLRWVAERDPDPWADTEEHH